VKTENLVKEVSRKQNKYVKTNQFGKIVEEGLKKYET